MNSKLIRLTNRDGLRVLLEFLTFRLETTRFLLDKPKFDYHPLPWVGIDNAATRGDSTRARCEAIKSTLRPSPGSTALDIGCCGGYFSISLTEMGYTVYGVDSFPKHIRIARYATPEKLMTRCHFLLMKVTPETVQCLPATDDTICLAVWHHWVRAYGLAGATFILQTVWNRTSRRLFFESGKARWPRISSCPSIAAMPDPGSWSTCSPLAGAAASPNWRVRSRPLLLLCTGRDADAARDIEVNPCGRVQPRRGLCLS